MAAGQGTRMRSSLPKVLHPVCGRPMVAWPVLAAREAGAARVAVIASPDRDLSSGLPEGTEEVIQQVADGTGGAVRAAAELIRAGGSDTVVVLSGDVPLLSAEVIGALLETHRAQRAAATMITAVLDDPGSYGRVVRDETGQVARVVETKHPEGIPAEILEIGEINTGSYAFDSEPLLAALETLTPDELTGEYFLPDVLPILRDGGHRIAGHIASDPAVNLGVNDRADLATVTVEARARLLEAHMRAGVTVIDPGSTWIDADVEIAPDVTLEPGCSLKGSTRVESGALIGPHTTLENTWVGEAASVRHSFCDGADVGPGATVGPFAYLRPGARLETGSKAGTFVEIKNSTVGEGAKVPHLSYVGDAEVGARANLGAGTITANYDGFVKNKTLIGEDARISVHTSLVAPIAVGERAYTGAGAVVRKDVPPDALAVSQGQQRNIEGYAEQRRQRAEQSRAGDRGDER
ncbi:bifunctional UDP-N-acetylglucosamine diphosphorylase/glucosamine-1-phosphate N-acetyltransferase GlmU [Thermoleophilia bacterium SCSIO 60948]|nr:bifunctional UDP-N-acetylglucosamine diphosphorylase/glucosamine-1-phosphate N-acetyltransferase GlmU [Thermoleophilia bacterium SCSIO 60948]